MCLLFQLPNVVCYNLPRTHMGQFVSWELRNKGVVSYKLWLNLILTGFIVLYHQLIRKNKLCYNWPVLMGFHKSTGPRRFSNSAACRRISNRAGPSEFHFYGVHVHISNGARTMPGRYLQFEVARRHSTSRTGSARAPTGCSRHAYGPRLMKKCIIRHPVGALPVTGGAHSMLSFT